SLRTLALQAPPSHCASSLSLPDALPILGVLMQPERYVWAKYFWEQARDANGVARRHLGDTTRNNGAPTVGSPFVALCGIDVTPRSEEHTSELQSRENLVCRLLPEKKKRV